VPSLDKANIRQLEKDIGIIEKELQARLTLVQLALAQLGGTVKPSDIDIGLVEDVTLERRDDSWQCQIKVTGKTSIPPLNIGNRQADRYLEHQKSVQELADRLQKEPYDEATRAYIEFHHAELTSRCNKRKHPNAIDVWKRDALAELSRMTS
jgi:hypothetical protein